MKQAETIPELIDCQAARHPKRPALLASDLASMSYEELALYLREAGEWLRSFGIGAASRVGIAFPRVPEAALATVALASHATVVPFNPTVTAKEAAAEAENARLDAIVFPSWTDLPEWALARRGKLGIFRVTKARSSLGEAVFQAAHPVPDSSRKAGTPGPDSFTAIFKSSGTTAAPKRIPVTHRNLVAMADKMHQWLGIAHQDRCMCVAPIYYNAGFKVNLVMPLALGGTVLFPSTSDPKDFARDVIDMNASWFMATPAYLQNWLDAMRAARRGTNRIDTSGHGLRFVLAGSSYLPDPLRRELEDEIGIGVLECYGLCEAGVMATNRPPPARRKPGTCGPVPEGEIAIFDEHETRILPRGGVGEIGLQGDSVTPGYLFDIDGAPAGMRNGWLFPGDRGYIDEDGYLVIVGRTKEMINRGGEKVSPYDVERVLLQHPAVREAAVFPVPHARLGENVAAAAVLNPGVHATSADLISYMHGHLAFFKVPRQVFLVDELPTGGRGKVSRPALTKMFSTRLRRATDPVGDVQQRIAEVWKRFLAHSNFGVDDDFLEAGGDSLQAVGMMAEVETIVGREIPHFALTASLTIRSLADGLSQDTGKIELITRGNQAEDGTPFFWCHGDLAARGLYAFKLAKLLEPHVPMFLIHPWKALGHDTALRFETMASAYVPELLAARPSGAFYLGGFCNGGLLAWEIARQLSAAGREIKLVVMVDTMSFNARLPFRLTKRLTQPFGERIGWHAMYALWRLARRNDLSRLVLSKVGQAAGRILPVRAGGGPVAAAAEHDITDLVWINSLPVMAQYVPPAVDTELVCLLSEECAKRKDHVPRAWARVASSSVVERISGNHDTCKTDHLGDLAGALMRHLRSSPSDEPIRSM